MSKIKINTTVTAITRNYKDGRQTIRFKDKRWVHDFTVIIDAGSPRCENDAAVKALHKEISGEWWRERYAAYYEEKKRFIERCDAKTVLEFTLLQLWTDVKLTKPQKEELGAMIKQKVGT